MRGSAPHPRHEPTQLGGEGCTVGASFSLPLYCPTQMIAMQLLALGPTCSCQLGCAVGGGRKGMEAPDKWAWLPQTQTSTAGKACAVRAFPSPFLFPTLPSPAARYRKDAVLGKEALLPWLCAILGAGLARRSARAAECNLRFNTPSCGGGRWGAG